MVRPAASRAGMRTRASTRPPATKNNPSDAIAMRWLPVVALTMPNASGPKAAEARPTSVWNPKYSDARSAGTMPA